ncbi:hypothetical protein AQS8620_00229 [Aquimixticola soesokkakensis]|uniref:DUF883 domain-containing protein n=1 Tax=Aquimixticola soesokkakensis TaxID=1519096 RepID=A0A1Y5RGW5_9RHOB|nr:DUF883 family protein [Aquimixticola soesokkakensis]SLN14417.1 hypothetical protein AQS8620_00229 [Aquimixticola soesokkakensis]
MAQTASDKTAELEAQIATLKADIGALTKTIGEYGKLQQQALSSTANAKVHELQSLANSTAKDLQAKGVEAGQVARASVEKGYADTEAAVRENPAAAVGIATGLGFLAGLLVARK